MKYWGDKPYRTLDYDLKQQFHEKLYKITLDAGLTCPNRDGTLDDRGCIFCSSEGSGDFAGDRRKSITEQLTEGKDILRRKRPIQSFIAYYQAFTNTYGELSYLEYIYQQAIDDPDVKLLDIATRPDCLGEDVLDLIGRMQQQKPIWMELGLQTIHEDTGRFIRRGYELDTFVRAVEALRSRNIPIVVHVILGLPGEDQTKIVETIEYLNGCDIQGIKLSLLHVLDGTDLGEMYKQEPFPIPSMEEYVELLAMIIRRLNPDISIHRLTGDGPSELLLAPMWSKNKRTVLNQLHRYLKEHGIYQGMDYSALGDGGYS